MLQGSTSRWTRKIVDAGGLSKVPIIVMGGAEHGPILKGMLRSRAPNPLNQSGWRSLSISSHSSRTPQQYTSLVPLDSNDAVN